MVAASKTTDTGQHGSAVLSRPLGMKQGIMSNPQKPDMQPQHSLLCSFCSFVSLRMYADSGKLDFCY